MSVVFAQTETNPSQSSLEPPIMWNVPPLIVQWFLFVFGFSASTAATWWTDPLLETQQQPNIEPKIETVFVPLFSSIVCMLLLLAAGVQHWIVWTHVGLFVSLQLWRDFNEPLQRNLREASRLKIEPCRALCEVSALALLTTSFSFEFQPTGAMFWVGILNLFLGYVARRFHRGFHWTRVHSSTIVRVFMFVQALVLGICLIVPRGPATLISSLFFLLASFGQIRYCTDFFLRP